MPRIVYATIAVVTLFTLSAHAQKPPSDATAVPVQVAIAKAGPIKSEIILSGAIEPRYQARLFADMPGRIAEISVDEGDTVHKGDVLAVIDHVTNLTLAVTQAQIQLQAATIRRDSSRTMAKVTLASQLQQARSAVATARAGLLEVQDLSEARVQSQLAQAVAGLEALRANLNKIREGAREQERAQVQSTVDQADANLENVEADFKRMRDLYESSVIAKQTFDGAEARYKMAQAQYEIALQQDSLVKEGARAEDIEAMEAKLRQAEAGLDLLTKMDETRTWEKDLTRAQANVDQAEAMLKVAETAWNTDGWMVEIGLAETQHATAEAGLAMAQRKLQDAYVKAPFDGIITARDADPGDQAMQPMPGGASLFQIADVDVVYATVTAAETDLRSLMVGQPAEVSTRFLDEPSSGSIQRISPAIDPRTHTAKVEIELPNADHALKAGAFAEARIVLHSIENAILAPRSAIFNLQENKGEVYIVRDGRSAKRSVEVGITNGAIVQITSGLAAGDTIVVSGQAQLSDNMPVRVIAAN